MKKTRRDTGGDDDFTVTYGSKKKRKKGEGDMKFVDPPVGRWIPAQLARIKKRRGTWGPGFSMAFKPILKKHRKYGWMWGILWNTGMSYDSKLYRWAKALNGGKKINLGPGVVVDFEDFLGNDVDVWCEESDSVNEEGKPYINVTKIRARRDREGSEPRRSSSEGRKKKMKSKKKRRASDVPF